MPTVKPAHPDEPLITLSIHAFVIDEIGEPVSGAKVTLFRNSDPVASESSDANGTAQFKDLALTRGIHILEAAKGDYVSEKQQLVVGSDMASSTQWIIFRLEEIEPPPVWRPLSAQYTPQKAREGPPHVLREPTVGVLHEPIRKERPADRLGDVKERWEGADAGEEEELVEEELNDLEPLVSTKAPAAAGDRVASPVVSEEEQYFRIRVYFATDREPARKKYFGNQRSTDGTLSLGLCVVAVPKTHRMGQMEKPSVFKLEFTEDPAKHIIILSVSTMREAYFLESVDMMAGKTTDQDALVFIHGYNVTFAEAVRRTAQIAFDLDFRGIPICYSWPSAANYAGYMADETSIDWTTPHLVEFLRKVIQLKNLKTVHLIAHSMGNRALVNCLSRMAAEFQQGGRAQLRQTILAAPDIDAGVFQQLAESFTKAAARTTLYASSKDLALQVSQQFHRYPRAGESGPAILVLPSIDTVDVSEVPSGFLGHSYYGGARSVLSDVYELIQSGAAPPRFGLRQSTGKNGIYWMFVP